MPLGELRRVMKRMGLEERDTTWGGWNQSLGAGGVGLSSHLSNETVWSIVRIAAVSRWIDRTGLGGAVDGAVLGGGRSKLRLKEACRWPERCIVAPRRSSGPRRDGARQEKVENWGNGRRYAIGKGRRGARGAEGKHGD